MAKKELKSFQEIISEEKRKAKPEDTAQHGRRIGQAERQTAASPKKGKNAGASLLYENKMCIRDRHYAQYRPRHCRYRYRH